QESRNDEDVVLQTSRVLDELFKTMSRHPEFFPSVFWCLRLLLTEVPFDEECKRVITSNVDRLAEIYSTKSLWTQYLIINEIRRWNIPELAVLLGNAIRNSRSNVTVPLRLLLHDVIPAAQERDQILPSYAMATGDNSTFTLGLAADGPVGDARKVPLEAVKKVSMSNSHTLFLTNKGDVFGCGLASNFGRDENNGSLVVNPIKLSFPGEALPFVDIAAGSHHSVFLTSKSVYVCGLNSNFCLGQKNDKCRYPMTKVKLQLPDGMKKVHFDKVFTNDHCTIVFAFVSATSELWIAGKTPLTVIEGFTRVEQGLDIYDVIRSDPNCLTMFSELEVVRIGFTSVIMPLVTFSYNHKKRKDLMVTLCNDAGTLKYTFDSHSGLVPLEPCVISVNGVLVDLRCVNYHVTAKGDVVFMGNPRNSCSDYYTLHRGKVVLIEDKEVEDGFTSAHGTGSIISGLRVFLLLQEFHGAHLVSSFACSQDGKNLLYVTNSSTSYCCDQWETTDFAKLNEERENACLDRIQLDFNVYDINEVRTSTFESIIRSRFPNLDKFIRNGNAVWIEDFLKEATNAKSKGIFHDYLILDKNLVRNRGSPTKALVEDVCRVIGVPYTTEGCFYKIGEPLLCLDDFVAERNCVLISEEGVEIEFVRELLEMQSSYFGVAFTYHKGDMPKLKLAAPEHVIRCTLLSIINPNYLRRIQTHEFLDLFAFLDQYLLHAVTADALRVMFERVNEFNVSFIFDLFESVPQLRHLIAKCFLHNLHLLTFWRNSTAASVELIRDAFVCMDLLMADEKPGNASMEFVSVQPPIIHILEDDREAQWCLFRTEDVTEVLLGAHGRDSSTEAAMIDYLENESRSNDFFQSSPADVSMPKLVMIIRSRINERESLKKSKRDRRKSSRQSGTQVEVSPTCSKEEEMEEMAICNTAPSGICNIAPSEEVMEHNENLQVECTMSDKEKNHGSPSPDRGVEVRGENESTSSTVRSAWKIPISPSSPVSTSFLLERSMTPKKRSSGKFTSKGVKYSDASSLLCETRQNTHFAPWAGTTSFQQASDVISVPLSSKKEAKIGRKSKRTALSFSEQETANLQRERAPDRNSWSESTLRFPHVTSPPKPSLAEIIKEEEHRLKEGTRRISRPLYFIEDEEHAIEELAQLYLQNVGDEVIVRVERCVDSCDDMSLCSPLWANTPYFRI
ncbi:hypothetical protein V3C99_004654, partial [Haemonchus contortus]